MQKSKFFLITGGVMWIVAILFVLVLMDNPGTLLPLPAQAATVVYILYLAVMVAMFILGIVFRKKDR